MGSARTVVTGLTGILAGWVVSCGIVGPEQTFDSGTGARPDAHDAVARTPHEAAADVHVAPPHCSAGENVTCMCPGGLGRGVQTCGADGGVVGSCRDCPDASTPDATSFDATVDVSDAEALDGGACGDASCEGLCQDGRCLETIAPNEDFPSCLAVDDTYVYWGTEGETSSVRRAPKTGGATDVLVADAGDVYSLAIDDSAVYWAEYVATGSILKVALTGRRVDTLVSGQDLPGGLAVNALDVFWTTDTTDGELGVIAKDGGNLPALVTGAESPAGTTLTSEYAYWLSDPDFTDAAIMRTKLDGTGTKSIFSNQERFGATPAVDANYLYVPTFDEGQILRVSLHGGAVTTLATGQLYPSTIAVDANFVYWTNVPADSSTSNVGDVVKVPIAGGSPVTLASGQVNARALVVDATSVYWVVDDNPGSVRKLSPK